MDLREIKKLVTLMNENGLTRLEVEEEGRRYLIEKGAANAPRAFEMNPGMTFAAPQGMTPAPVPAPAPKPTPEDTETFNSPMVGTFYRATSPDAEPFAKVGDRVEADTVLCLIEAMKVFNEIKAERSGTVIEVLAENQEAVEYNQPLFLIKPH